MNLSDQKVYVGNKLYRRTVWNVHGERDLSYAYGFVRFAGQLVCVWAVGCGLHWNTMKPEEGRA